LLDIQGRGDCAFARFSSAKKGIDPVPSFGVSASDRRVMQENLDARFEERPSELPWQLAGTIACINTVE
jgi:hypothetical protein